MKLTFLEGLEYAGFVFVMAILTLIMLSLMFKLFSYVVNKITKIDIRKIFSKKETSSNTSQPSEFEGPIYATVTDENGNQRDFKLASIKKLKEND